MGFINFCSGVGIFMLAYGLQKIVSNPTAALFWRRNYITRKTIVRMRKGNRIEKVAFTRETYTILYLVGLGILWFSAGMLFWLW